MCSYTSTKRKHLSEDFFPSRPTFGTMETEEACCSHNCAGFRNNPWSRNPRFKNLRTYRWVPLNTNKKYVKTFRIQWMPNKVCRIALWRLRCWFPCTLNCPEIQIIHIRIKREVFCIQLSSMDERFLLFWSRSRSLLFNVGGVMCDEIPQQTLFNCKEILLVKRNGPPDDCNSSVSLISAGNFLQKNFLSFPRQIVNLAVSTFDVLCEVCGEIPKWNINKDSHGSAWPKSC